MLLISVPQYQWGSEEAEGKGLGVKNPRDLVTNEDKGKTFLEQSVFLQVRIFFCF